VEAAVTLLEGIVKDNALPGSVRGEVCDAGNIAAIKDLFEGIGELDRR